MNKSNEEYLLFLKELNRLEKEYDQIEKVKSQIKNDILLLKKALNIIKENDFL